MQQPSNHNPAQATGAVFLSYASQDAEVARHIAESLRAAGIEVWFDQSELKGGAAWDTEIRGRIKQCALFVPLISAHTEQRREGYFRLEWRLADQRTHMMAKGTPFVVPVVIDDTSETSAHVPDAFLDAQWTRCREAKDTEALVRCIRELLVATDAPTAAHDNGWSSAVQRAPSISASSVMAMPANERRWGKAGIAAIAVLLLAIGGMTLWRVNGGGENAGPSGSTVATTPVALADRSFAVLPFTNLSGDAGQEYFSDGLTEEITTALARIRDLKVVGRTSAFEFKGKNQDLRAIGQALGARYLLEGSVRKDGDRLRITAQLIEAAGGSHLWADSYDRNLTDVFAIQEEIATAIAGALRVSLGLKPGEQLVTNRTTDVESYQDYLRAKALYSSLALGSTEQAMEVLERVVARTPEFAPAWALLARAYLLAPNRSIAGRSGSFDEARRTRESRLRRAEEATQRAVKLDPMLPDGYIALGRLHTTRGNLLAAEEAYDKALALDPNYPDALYTQGIQLGFVGQPDRALAMQLRVLALEPFNPQFNLSAADITWVNGDTDTAMKLLRDVPSSTADRNTLLVRILASQGRFSEAADALHEFPPESFLPGIVAEAERLLRSAPAPVSSRQSLPLGRLRFVYLYVGAPDRMLEDLEGTYDAGIAFMPGVTMLWHPSYSSVRKTGRFKSLVRKVGIVDYWRARGWPKFCQPVGADDFSCS